ncbi:MAG: sigma-70 family RNA polymerase sigma factor [Chthonomonadetes bacterium]|nr:sigma-70 family RNA polymerase sigma factor [Chthonomonadetes bacterium]
MSRFRDDQPSPSRCEQATEYAEMPAHLEQIAQQALRRTQGWKVPPCYEPAYWEEERISIARIAVWSAHLSYDPNAGVAFSVYAFFSAVQAIRREHRLAWRWSSHVMPLPCDETTGEEIDPADPAWQTPFEHCEQTCDIQRALRSLSDAERSLLSFWYEQEMTEREIARRMNLSKTAVHKRLVQLRCKLQSVLADLPAYR